MTQTNDAQRLRDAAEVRATLQSGSRQHGQLLVVHVRERQDAGEPRLAVVASRRVGGAVQRNRAKRLLREAGRRLPWREGIDVVTVARTGAARADLEAVLDDLRGCAQRLGALTSTSRPVAVDPVSRPVAVDED